MRAVLATTAAVKAVDISSVQCDVEIETVSRVLQQVQCKYMNACVIVFISFTEK